MIILKRMFHLSWSIAIFFIYWTFITLAISNFILKLAGSWDILQPGSILVDIYILKSLCRDAGSLIQLWRWFHKWLFRKYGLINLTNTYFFNYFCYFFGIDNDVLTIRLIPDDMPNDISNDMPIKIIKIYLVMIYLVAIIGQLLEFDSDSPLYKWKALLNLCIAGQIIHL